MQKLLQQLKEPFPSRKSLGQSFMSLLGVGVFVSGFLLVIRPFNLNLVQEPIIKICLGFGLVTVLFGFIFDLFNRYVLRIQTDLPSWTLGKWIIQTIFLLLWITLGNFLFMNLLYDWTYFQAGFIVQMFFPTLFVGIFPVVFSGLMTQLRATKGNQAAATQLHPHVKVQEEMPQAVIEFSLGSSQSLSVPTSALRYLESMQNYVAIFYLNEGELKKELLRNTMSKLEVQLKDSTTVRCHRSYMVNTDMIEEVSGNAQGLKLRLSDVPQIEIPVSRSYIPKLRELL